MPQPTTSQYSVMHNICTVYNDKFCTKKDFQPLKGCLLFCLCRYYGNGQTGKESEFYYVGLLDSFIHMVTLHQTASELQQPKADLWLGETSSLYDGGAPHLSDSYVTGFMLGSCTILSVCFSFLCV